MTDTNDRAVIGGNNPPDPIDEITRQWESSRIEAENWTDGSLVENDEQMKCVDALRADMRKWRLALEAGQKSATAPLYDAYKREGERWKPTIEDAKRIEGCLVAVVDAYKRKLQAERDEAERLARAEANRKMREAEEAARQAAASDLEAQRAAAEAKRAADEAVAQAKAAADATAAASRGMRTVKRYEITDHRAALHDIAAHDRDAITAFIEEYVRRNFKARPICGVRVWDEKEAF